MAICGAGQLHHGSDRHAGLCGSPDPMSRRIPTVVNQPPRPATSATCSSRPTDRAGRARGRPLPFPWLPSWPPSDTICSIPSGLESWPWCGVRDGEAGLDQANLIRLAAPRSHQAVQSGQSGCHARRRPAPGHTPAGHCGLNPSCIRSSYTTAVNAPLTTIKTECPIAPIPQHTGFS